MMEDNINIKNSREGSGGEGHEPSYLEEPLTVAEQIKRAIAAVGNDREKIEEYFRKRK